tara:strand:+ start:470 stop:910 length:441 start_codon:yes stop_codon:yes gene_type:complete
MKTKKQKIFLLLSIGVFIISLTQKSYCTSREVCRYFSGFLDLIFGWFGVFMLYIPTFPWLANPLLLVSWILFRKKPKASFILSIVAFILMLSFLLVDKIITNEAGTKSKVVSYELGYWLWLFSSFIMLIGNSIHWKKNKQKPQHGI